MEGQSWGHGPGKSIENYPKRDQDVEDIPHTAISDRLEALKGSIFQQENMIAEILLRLRGLPDQPQKNPGQEVMKPKICISDNLNVILSIVQNNNANLDKILGQL